MTKIYCANSFVLKDAALYKKVHLLLPPSVQEKVDRIAKDESRFNSLCAWILLRYALSIEGIDLLKEEIEYGQYDKPSLVSKKIHFNLSHSKSGLVVCAISDNSVGIDVEDVVEHDLSIAKRYFAPSEYSALKKSEDKASLFTKFWCMKESLLKRIGTGLSSPLDEYDFSSWAEDISFDAFGSHFALLELANSIISVSYLGEGIEELRMVELASIA